ncbi:YibE/F family protein [Microlunatus panaciterrae]|uniref:Membrane protein n=1 Tax=Microlunatus panaciterrae TaxID=400768 RepID=A0ABS2RID9_9ACTN|nr:YibE/F family protein [Microlunatus panaciterrae]MBM7798761.1 putative membrane protein [Microlunatus panaciterrae]
MVAHTHSHEVPTTPEGIDRHRKALRMMVVVLIPLAIWTLAGLIVLWPGNIDSHIQKDLSQYTVSGVTYPTGTITAIEEISCEGVVGSTQGATKQVCANISVKLKDGPETGQTIQTQLSNAIYASGAEVGQTVKLIRLPIEGAPAAYQFSDFERRAPLVVLSLLFAAAVIIVARWRGLASLLGLAFAGFILVKFMFPALIAGSSPVLVGLIGSSAIMFVVLYAAHGFSARTTTALIGTLFGLILSATLGWAATRWAHLTGVTSDDDYVLAATAPDLNLTSVVICGIIVAGLGVLNDVTITQASAVWELADSDPDQSKLFSRAMRIGRDHIASTVYTIAFATAGAVLPVLLLIAIYDRPMLEVLQTEMFSSEIIRTVVGSIGLVLAVPLTTAIGVAVVRASGRGLPRGGAPTEVSPPRSFEPEGSVLAGLAARLRGSRRNLDADRPQKRRRRRDDDDFAGFDYLKDDETPKGGDTSGSTRGRTDRPRS